MIHPFDGRTDGRAIAYTRYSIYAVARKNTSSRSLQLTRIDFNKTGLIICSYFIFILRFEKTQLEKVGGDSKA